MFRLSAKIPRNPIVALSGGADSSALLHFCINGKKNPIALFIDHHTEESAKARRFLFANLTCTLITRKISKEKPKNESWEEFWRNERQKIFFSYLDRTILTGHHLNDVAEWWVMSSLHGESKLIPSQNRNISRPFLKVTKEQILDYCSKNNIQFIEDQSNLDTSYSRNYVRHNLLPLCLKVNPGLFSTLRRKYDNVCT